MGRDSVKPAWTTARPPFQSTRPAWGATRGAELIEEARHAISIHAPRMGRDLTIRAHCLPGQQFQSTRPAWGATYTPTWKVVCTTFQSTRPAWGATRLLKKYLTRRRISIHAPRMGRDTSVTGSSGDCSKFQSTRPAWGATYWRVGTASAIIKFQSTRPAWGATRCLGLGVVVRHDISIHAPRMGRDPVAL